MYNKVIMIGRLTSTPELHKTNNDKSVARATIAINRRFKDQNGEREADFINIVVWGKLAETLASYASKGSLISVDGELRTRKFEKNGQTNYVTEVLATGFQLLDFSKFDTEDVSKIREEVKLHSQMENSSFFCRIKSDFFLTLMNK